MLPMMREKSDSAFRKPLLAAIKEAGVDAWDKITRGLFR